MGLDMNVYRVHKPSLDVNRLYDMDELGDVVIGEKDINRPMFRQLLPYCVKVSAVNHYYDLKKIGEDYGLEDVHVGGWSCNKDGCETYFNGFKGGRSASITIQDDLIEREYIIDREEICYVCAEAEVRYWRKAYDIQEWFHENIPEPVENTGYYVLTGEMLSAFNQEFPEDALPETEPDETSALVYWEWY